MSRGSETKSFIIPVGEKVSDLGSLTVQKYMARAGIMNSLLPPSLGITQIVNMYGRSVADRRLLLVEDSSNEGDHGDLVATVEGLEQRVFDPGTISIVRAKLIEHAEFQPSAEKVQVTLERGDPNDHKWLPEQPNLDLPMTTQESGVVLGTPSRPKLPILQVIPRL